MARDKPLQAGIIALANALEVLDMDIEHASRKKIGSANMGEQAIDDIRVVNKMGENRRGLQML